MAKPSKQIKILNCICLWLTLVPLASHLEAKVTKSAFGNMPDGTKVEIYTLEEGAIKARVMTYGARLVSLEVPDRNGKVADIVLGYESLAATPPTPRATSDPSSAAMATASPTPPLPWMASAISFRRTTVSTPCTGESKASTSWYGKGKKSPMGSSSPWSARMAIRAFRAP
jgi:hypothetical protein